MRPDYYLLERSTKRKFHKLSFTKVIHMLSILPEDELVNWYFWQKGMDKWRPVNNDPVLISGIKSCRAPQTGDKQLPEGIEPPEIEPSKAEVTTLTAMDDGSLEEQKSSELKKVKYTKKKSKYFLAPDPIELSSKRGDLSSSLPLSTNRAKDIEPSQLEKTRTLILDTTQSAIKEEAKTFNSEAPPPPLSQLLNKKPEIPPLPNQAAFDKEENTFLQNKTVNKDESSKPDFDTQLEVNKTQNSVTSDSSSQNSNCYDPLEANTELIPTDPLMREDTVSVKTKLIDTTAPLPQNFDPEHFKSMDLSKKDDDPILKLIETTTVPPEFITQSEGSIKTPTGDIADDRRRTKRFDLNFRLMISNGEDSIISFSSNISLGGIMLAHELPLSFVGTSCEVFVMNNETRESLQLACMVLGTVTDRQRIAFNDKNVSNLEKLLNWMGQGKLLQSKKVG